MNVIINVLRVPVDIFICVCACKVCVVCARVLYVFCHFCEGDINSMRC